jgi:hypothetical protein
MTAIKNKVQRGNIIYHIVSVGTDGENRRAAAFVKEYMKRQRCQACIEMLARVIIEGCRD